MDLKLKEQKDTNEQKDRKNNILPPIPIKNKIQRHHIFFLLIEVVVKQSSKKILQLKNEIKVRTKILGIYSTNIWEKRA